jgi:hypothetical protein
MKECVPQNRRIICRQRAQLRLFYLLSDEFKRNRSEYLSLCEKRMDIWNGKVKDYL